jgi:hypothetical protein
VKAAWRAGVIPGSLCVPGLNSTIKIAMSVAPSSADADISARPFLGCLSLLILAGIIVGVLAMGNYLVHEHRRLSGWESLLVWLGDGVALLWFSVYFVRHWLLAKPVKEFRGSKRRITVLWWMVLLSILTSTGVDLWMTLRLRESERQAFARSSRTEGTIEQLSKTPFSARVAYVLRCRYTDRDQVVRQAVFQVRDPDELPKLAPQVAQAIRQEQLPIQVAVAYDPERPARCWLAELGWDDSQRLCYFSLLVLLFQGLLSLGFMALLTSHHNSEDVLPWWYDQHSVFLVAVEAAVVLLFGGIMLLLGIPLFWG